jgi:hypothetical protein
VEGQDSLLYIKNPGDDDGRLNGNEPSCKAKKNGSSRVHIPNFSKKRKSRFLEIRNSG